MIMTGHALNPRAAAAYAAALRTIPGIAWARSINDSESSSVRIHRALEGSISLTVELNTVEECVALIHEETERD